MKIRALNQDELELLFFYINLENWTLDTLHIKTLYKLHPNDFFIAFKDEKLLGFILALKHSHEFGMISTFLILKEFRSLGFGQTIFEHALNHLNGCQIALDANLENKAFYEKFAFKEYFNVYTYKYITDTLEVKNQTIKICNFDKKSSVKDKNKYQINILKDKNIIYKEIRNQNRTNSFAYMSSFADGHKITIESNDINEAISLFLALTKEVALKSSIYIEVSKLSSILTNIASILEMKIDSELIRMYNKILSR